MVKEVTYNGHTYKVGELVYFEQSDAECTMRYFGKIKSIELRKNEFWKENDKYDNTYTLETLYTDYGYKFNKPFESEVINCELRPAKEMLDQIIRAKQEEIKALTEIYKEIYKEI